MIAFTEVEAARLDGAAWRSAQASWEALAPGLVVQKVWPAGPTPGSALVALAADARGERWALWLGLEAALPGAVAKSLKKDRCRSLQGLPTGLAGAVWSVTRDPALPALRRWLRGPGADADVVGLKPLRRVMTRITDGTGEAEGGEPVTRYVKWVRERDLELLRRTYRTLAAAGPDVPWAIPEADPQGRPALIWSAAAGVPLTDRLAGTPEAARAAVAAVGRALAELHRQPLLLPLRHGRWREMETLGRWAHLAERLHPAACGPLAAAAAGLAERVRTTPRERLVPSHRDLHDGQVLITGSSADPGATLLDLDTAALAEPELDVANFTAHLRLRGLGAEAGAAFRDGYAAAGGPDLETEALAFYRAAAELRLSCVHRFRPVDETWWRRWAAGALGRAQGPSRRIL